MHSSEGQSHKHSIVLLQWTLFHFLVTMCVCFVNVPVLWAKLAMSTRFRIIWTRSKSPLFRLYNTVQTEGHRRSIYPKYPESLIVQTAHRPNPSVLFAIYIYIHILYVFTYVFFSTFSWDFIESRCSTGIWHSVSDIVPLDEPSASISNGGLFNFGCVFPFLISFCFSWLLASGFWLVWLLAFVAFGFRGFCGFCGFWLSWLLRLLAFVAFVALGFLAYPSIYIYICLYLSVYIYLSISIYLSIYLSFFLSFFLFGSCSPFSFCICFSCCLRCRDETKQGSKQASKQASEHELLTFGSGVLLGGVLRPPQPPPRHEICTSSPTPAPATKSIF